MWLKHKTFFPVSIFRFFSKIMCPFLCGFLSRSSKGKKECQYFSKYAAIRYKKALPNFYTKVAILLIPKRHEDLINKNFQANFWCRTVVYIISIIF